MVWAKRLGWALLGGVALLALSVGWRVAPLIRDSLLMDSVVVRVVLDWRDQGRDRALQTLQFELDRQGISEHVSERDCVLEETAEAGKDVRCAWEVRLRLPLFDRWWTLAFVSRARVDPRGALVM